MNHLAAAVYSEKEYQLYNNTVIWWYLQLSFIRETVHNYLHQWKLLSVFSPNAYAYHQMYVCPCQTQLDSTFLFLLQFLWPDILSPDTYHAQSIYGPSCSCIIPKIIWDPFFQKAALWNLYQLLSFLLPFFFEKNRDVRRWKKGISIKRGMTSKWPQSGTLQKISQGIRNLL